MNRFLIILPLLLFLQTSIAANGSPDSLKKNYCSSSKYWSCNLFEPETIPNWVEQASSFDDSSNDNDGDQQQQKQKSEVVDDLLLRIAYQTPVDDQTGQLYVALRLAWRLNKEFIQSNNVTFWLRINQLEHGDAFSTGYLKIDGIRKDDTPKKNRMLSYTEFNAFIEKRLKIGRDYELSLIHRINNESKILISSHTLNIPTIHLDAAETRKVTCDSEHIEKSRKIAARWVSSQYVVVYSIKKYIEIKFYAAPKWFCFDRYEIKVTENNTFVVQTFVVHEKDLYKNGSNWMGVLKVDGLKPEKNYSVQVKPFEYRENGETCLCRISSSCDCVLSASSYFSLENTGKNLYGKVLEERYLAEQRGKKVKKETAKIKPLVMVFLIFSIIAAILIIAFLLICLYRTVRRSSKWQKTLLLKNSGSGDSLTPLIKNPPVQKVFILNPNSSKTEYVNELAKLLQSKGIKVYYFPFDSVVLEENAFYYVHKAISDSDKIILFHCDKTQQLINEGKINRQMASMDFYDNAFIIAFSLLKLNDSKILHANFIDDPTTTTTSMKSVITETIYTLPRDLPYFFQALRLPNDPNSINHLNESLSPKNINDDDNETKNLPHELLENVVITNINEDPIPKTIIPQNQNQTETENLESATDIQTKETTKIDDLESTNTDSGIHSM